MVTPALTVLASGARTPLGFRSAPIAAALRAGINRLGEHPHWIDRLGNPMVAALDSELDPHLDHPARLCVLAETALAEICAAVPRFAVPPSVRLFLALPELRPGFTARDAEQVRAHLAALPGLPFHLRSVDLFPLGHAGGAVALQTAAEAAAQGQDWCLVGGVDSYFHPRTMDWLDSHGQLAGEDARSAFVPGEGAGMLLLGRTPLPPHLPGQARITGIGLAVEQALIKTEALCVGLSLTTAVEGACAGLPAGYRVNDVACDLNGERSRAQEWGFASLRVARHFDNPLDFRAPAGSWGDMGAASIPLFAMLACQAAARRYARGPHALAWASSEGGQRGAVLLQLPFTPKDD